MLKGVDYTTGEEVWIPNWLERFISLFLEIFTSKEEDKK